MRALPSAEQAQRLPDEVERARHGDETIRSGRGPGLRLAFLELAFLIAGPLILVPGPLVWGGALVRNASLPAPAATCLGFGAAWVLLIGQAGVRCANDPTCAAPDTTVVWLVPGVVALGVGAVLGVAARMRLRHT